MSKTETALIRATAHRDADPESTRKPTLEQITAAVEETVADLYRDAGAGDVTVNATAEWTD